MVYIIAMISMGMSMAYAGSHADIPILLAIGLLLYSAGLIIGQVIENRTDDRIKKLEKEIKELKENGKGNTL